MEEVYERMMLDEQSQRGFAQFFDDVLAAEDGSVLWHCTIGKDRAGLAAALLLHALGVKREAVEQDYLATNKYVQSETARRARCRGEAVRQPRRLRARPAERHRRKARGPARSLPHGRSPRVTADLPMVSGG